MSAPSLDWRSIRPLNGGCDKGFEELISQLARSHSPSASRFVRKGTPDAGVECYAVLPSGEEWGWQAKYFTSLRSTQWAQVDASVAKALQSHPRLVRYFICIPLDRADGRVGANRSAMDKWEQYVTKWRDLASARNMAVDFVYWGSHELLTLLAHPENAGRVAFWFHIREFDNAWFRRQLDVALGTAGPRFTPELNIDLPLALDLAAFGRTSQFVVHAKTRSIGIREKLRLLEYAPRIRNMSIHPVLDTVYASVRAALHELSTMELPPVGPSPLKALLVSMEAAENSATAALEACIGQEKELEIESGSSRGTAASKTEMGLALRACQTSLLALISEITSAREWFANADAIASSTLLLLRGAAGSGKTHLLCDLARQRLDAYRPTILMMGQLFISESEPWPQALQQLDLAELSTEGFVSAIECAAEAAHSRALVMIDGLNEGKGRQIWASHLPAFLARLQRSPWIGVVLSVRTSYEDSVVPPEVRGGATRLTHPGFAHIEYDATRSFFAHFGIEFPSTPLLSVEFRNPLFLKTLCQGLHDRGERRVPRGFHGINAAFELYLSGINQRLARDLGFDARDSLAQQALRRFAEACVDAGDNWLALDRAKEVVNGLLPGRNYEKSLFRGLVGEGALVEESAWSIEGGPQEVVFICYERLADHLRANILLDRHLDERDPAAAFAPGAALALWRSGESAIDIGLFEAMCIQVPARAKRELMLLQPSFGDSWELRSAFRQSVVWRTHTDVTRATGEVLLRLVQDGDHELAETLDVLVTVSTLPDHALNAYFLDEMLRKCPMPRRDSAWSVYLHHAWRSRGAVDRLVDWAASVGASDEIDSEVAVLCAVTMAWFFSTSHRNLRDRATKAVVNLLTDRLEVVNEMVGRLHDVDDPYVVERVFAVAYGVATRSADKNAVGRLATIVYGAVFAAGKAVCHVLQRDYARGVVERAAFLGAEGKWALASVRPPYGSAWPSIPSEDDLRPWLDRRSGGGGQPWPGGRIVSSVMDDDFGRYVIGTNSGSTNFLSLRLTDEPWDPSAPATEKGAADVIGSQDKRSNTELRFAPRFQLSDIQRYVLKRVFDLGWTAELFGDFDRALTWRYGRTASKPERIGKKYQWIAYHEIMAMVADNFQYRETVYEEDGDQAYLGPWQVHLRDIDPSNTIASVRGGTSWSGHVPAWWGVARYDQWGSAVSDRDWVLECDGLPRVEELLLVNSPVDGSRWLNGQGYFNWQQRLDQDGPSASDEPRDLWYMCHGYLVRKQDADAFLKWAETVDFWGRWMPEAGSVYGMFLGEHAWSPAGRYYETPYYGDEGWSRPDYGCPVEIRTVALEYSAGGKESDCSIEQSFRLRLPVGELVRELGLRWDGRGAAFVDADGQVVAQDPTVDQEGPDALLFRADVLDAYFSARGLAMCWAVCGEKRVLWKDADKATRCPRLRLSGAFGYVNGAMKGFVKYMEDDLHTQQEGLVGSAGLRVVKIERSGT